MLTWEGLGPRGFPIGVLYRSKFSGLNGLELGEIRAWGEPTKALVKLKFAWPDLIFKFFPSFLNDEPSEVLVALKPPDAPSVLTVSN